MAISQAQSSIVAPRWLRFSAMDRLLPSGHREHDQRDRHRPVVPEVPPLGTGRRVFCQASFTSSIHSPTMAGSAPASRAWRYLLRLSSHSLSFLPRCGEPVLLGDVGAGCGFEGGASVVDVVVIEELGEPLVDGWRQGVFSHVDGLGVLVFCDRVLGRELASVVGALVVP